MPHHFAGGRQCKVGAIVSSAASKFRLDAGAHDRPFIFHDARALTRKGDAALIGLPTKIGVRNELASINAAALAVRLRRVRLVHRGLDRVALLAPPVEGVARLHSKSNCCTR